MKRSLRNGLLMNFAPVIRGRIPPSESNSWEVAVTSIGGVLPSWASVEPAPTGHPHFEIVIVRDTSVLTDEVDRLRETQPRIRLAVIREDSTGSVVPDCTLCVLATPKHLDLVAEAFAKLSTGTLFVGVDMIELLMVAKAMDLVEAPDPAGRRSVVKKMGSGRSVIIEGHASESLSRTIRDHDQRFCDLGYAGGRLILQLVGEHERSSLTLFDLDQFFTAAREGCPDRDLVITAAPASLSAVLMIGFA
jgi:hypothetical protein